MSEHDSVEFLSLETELTKLQEHLVPLKKEMEKYKSAAEQLSEGRKSLGSASKDVMSQGKLMANAAEEAASALKKASQALVPLGTTEIKADLKSMQDHLDKTVEELSVRLNAVGDAAKEISDSAASTKSMPQTIANDIQQSFTAHATYVEGRFTDIERIQTDQTQVMPTKLETQSEFRALTARLETLEKMAMEMSLEKKQQDKLIQKLGISLSKELSEIEKKLMDAIEYSAPKSLFRKKKTND